MDNLSINNPATSNPATSNPAISNPATSNPATSNLVISSKPTLYNNPLLLCKVVAAIMVAFSGA